MIISDEQIKKLSSHLYESNAKTAWINGARKIRDIYESRIGWKKIAYEGIPPERGESGEFEFYDVFGKERGIVEIAWLTDGKWWFMVGDPISIDSGIITHFKKRPEPPQDAAE
jgi:hypothetical protein